MKETVVFDFDGVIHSYSSGWQGVGVIPDPPVPGIKEAIDEIRAAGYEVVVVSTRTASEKGYGAVRAWLMDHDITVDKVCAEKPPAIVYIDDRALCFDGHPETLLGKIMTFKPWHKAEKCPAEKMDRLTTDNPKDNFSGLMNFAYAKDKEVYLSYADGEEDIRLADYIAKLAAENGCSEITRADVLDGACLECDCPAAVLNIVAIQAAELRSRLKAYEDTECMPEDLKKLKTERKVLRMIVDNYRKAEGK